MAAVGIIKGNPMNIPSTQRAVQLVGLTQLQLLR